MIACNATWNWLRGEKREKRIREELRAFRGSLTSIMIGLFFRKLIPAIGRIGTEQIRGDTRVSKIEEKMSEEILKNEGKIERFKR